MSADRQIFLTELVYLGFARLTLCKPYLSRQMLTPLEGEHDRTIIGMYIKMYMYSLPFINCLVYDSSVSLLVLSFIQQTYKVQTA